MLHVSDIHMTPSRTRRQRWLTELSGLEPDLVVDTGDNLAHPDAVPFVVRSLGRLLDVPGVYVWGSNDYYGPVLKNPLRYLSRRGHGANQDPGPERDLPWVDLGEAFSRRGWTDLTHTTATIEIEGVRIGFRGTDDAHLKRDHYAEVAGPVDRSAVDVAIGVTHAPYRRVLDAMTADGLDLVLAGHTHGGQVAIPGYGALVTNCDLDTAPGQGPLPEHGRRAHRVAARLRRAGHVPVLGRPLRLPARGDAAHPDVRRVRRLSRTAVRTSVMG